MRRTITTTVRDLNGQEQPYRVTTSDSVMEIAAFVTSHADEHPNEDVTFTVRSEPEEHDKR
jgi:hypothetical protein